MERRLGINPTSLLFCSATAAVRSFPPSFVRQRIRQARPLEGVGVDCLLAIKMGACNAKEKENDENQNEKN